MSQEAYFSSVGGDDYFERNADGQGIPRREFPAFDLIKALPTGALPGIGRAAVLGGAGGREAAALAELLPEWTITNVDISERAIAFGKKTFPEINHHRISIASQMPSLAAVIGVQDLVFTVGVLLWVDRLSLSRAIANIDESLNDGGYLLITEFLPSGPRKNPIRHSPEHYTYKQDYSAPFLSLETYEVISMSSQVASEPQEISADERRLAHHLLRKDIAGRYPIGWSG